MPTKGMPVPGLKADGRKICNSLCTGSASKDHSVHSSFLCFRDVSYLCDVVMIQEDKRTAALKSSFSQSPQEQSSGTVSSTPQATLADSLVPEEFHIVRKRGVLPLKYFDE
ncbi:hypothetical protein CIB84_002065 [Bambusicola thoracicus]|uniref:Uncharacterized protein n=1 Tax=Bambusicola thoracicus TaxID=9083 RepID=A0A2P4TCV2_BAMTH|nr:hypothetical protein CIB84_002065 [Bambusicola thoracicus]